jgi:acetyltransferase-like isoleucine patch superfamily enzyme
MTKSTTDSILEPARWTDGRLPANVRAGDGTLFTGSHSFRRFYSRRDPALIVGVGCTMDGPHFALGKDAIVHVGDHCYFTNCTLLCEQELRFGNYVMIGWGASIADTDFHPIEPAERLRDAVACSPLGGNRQRPEIAKRPVIIEDDVWIGPNATILKGVRIGAGAFIEAGAMVTHDVPPRARVLGNPAQIVGEVS